MDASWCASPGAGRSLLDSRTPFRGGPRRWTLSLLLALGLGGCISSSPDPEHLAQIDALARERLGTPLDTAQLLKAPPHPREEPPTGVLTLDEAVARTLSRNLSLVASAENIAVAQAQLAQTGLLPNPVVQTSLQWVSPKALTTDLIASLMQELNSILTRSTRLEIGRAQRFQVGIDLAAQAFDLAEQVESKYRSLAHLIRARKLADQIVAQYDRAVKAAEARARVGVVPAPDVNRARIQWEDSQRQVRKLEAQYHRGARELNWLLGISTVPQWTLPEDLSEIPKALPKLPEVALAETIALRYRLDLRRAELDVRIGESGVSLARWGFVPEIQLGVAYERTEDRARKLGPALSVALPVFDPGVVGFQLAVSRLRLAQKIQDALEGQVRQDVRSAYATIDLDIKDVEFYRDRIIPQQEENIRLAEQSFRLGNTDLDSLLNTLRDYVTSLQGYEDSAQTYFDDLVAFQRSIGAVWRRIVEEETKLKEGQK